MAGLILFCLFLFIPLSKQHSVQNSLDKVVNSLELIVDFLQNDYQNLNLDGFFGLRILEGHLEGILQKYDNSELIHLKADTVASIRKLQKRTTDICREAIKSVKEDNLSYFTKMSFIVGSPWTVFDPRRKRVDPSKVWSDLAYQYAKTNKVKVDEHTSDKCMSELMGSEEPGHKSEPCSISESCAITMSHPGILGYGITHQLLWTMLAEKAGCKNHLEAKLDKIQRGTIASVRLELCTNNYVQLIDTVGKLKGTVLPPLQDLFLEQLFVCPSVGFYEFLDINYLPQILSWQHRSGCYGRMTLKSTEGLAGIDKQLMGKFDYHDVKSDDALFKDVDSIDLQPLIDSLSAKARGQLGGLKTANRNAVEMNKPHGQGLGLNQEPYNINRPFTGRRLLIEKEMSDGCLAHKTAVATGALVLYLRYLCEPDAALIFNRSRSPRSIKSVAQNNVQGPDNNLANNLPPGAETGARNTLSTKGVDNDNEKLPLIIDDKKGFVNESENEFVNVNANVKDLDAGKKYIHGDDIGNERFDFSNKQLNPPDILGNLNRLHADKDLLKNAGVDDDYDGDEDYEEGADDDEDEDDDEEEEDYDYNKDDGAGNKEDGYEYDNENGKVDKDNEEDYDEDTINANQKHVLVKPAQYQNNDLDNDNGEDSYNADDGDDDRDYDGDYVENDNDEIAHPHINARNLGQNKNKNYDHAAYDQYEKSVNREKDYKYDDEEEDDEEGDDYEYDDENDEVEENNKQQDIVGGDFVANVGTVKDLQPIVKKRSQPESGHISDDNSVSPKTVFLVFLVCFIVCLLLMYRFIRKRRIRIRFNPKYFHV